MALTIPATGQEIIDEINGKLDLSGGTITGDVKFSGKIKTDLICDSEGNQMIAKTNLGVVGKDNVPIAQIISGSYTGDGSSERIIELGFKPKYVLIKKATTNFNSSGSCTSGIPVLALETSPAYNSVSGVSGNRVIICNIEDSGFKVYYGTGASNYRDTNAESYIYHYIVGR